MGEHDAARIDTAAVGAAADQFDSAAEQLDRAARTRLVFDGATAGRAHTADGDALRRALEAITDDLAACARAAAEVAAALRTGANRYTDADLAATARIG